MTINQKELRFDHRIIGRMVNENSRVLDLGCGRGDLLEYLVLKKNVKGSGVEIDEKAIYSCVEKGLSVSHSDIDSGLREYPDGFFDFVIFNQTMQQVQKPKEAIKEGLRIGREVIIGFPNFCCLTSRVQIFFAGHVPVTPSLPYSWYDTPNLHFLSIKDFIRFAKELNVTINEKVFLADKKKIHFFPNIFAHNAIFRITR